MIDPKEVRIGSYISDDEGCLAKVIGLKPHDHLVRCDSEEGCQILVDCYYASGSIISGCVADSMECEPIPLTPEWLEKLDFTVNTKVWWEFPGKSDFQLLDNSPFEKTFSLTEDHTLLDVRPLEYVHQLQNLFYIITGKELTIKSFNQSN